MGLEPWPATFIGLVGGGGATSASRSLRRDANHAGDPRENAGLVRKDARMRPGSSVGRVAERELVMSQHLGCRDFISRRDRDGDRVTAVLDAVGDPAVQLLLQVL